MAKGDRQNVQSGLDDILGSVIKTDRRNSGRRVEETPTAPSTPADGSASLADQVATSAPQGAILGVSDDRAVDKPSEVSEASVITSDNKITQYGNNTLTHYDNSALTQGVEEINESTQRVLVARRHEEAVTLAASPTTTVTLRVPHALNDWMDEYIHGAWPEKIKKQQLLIEALQLLYVRRGRPKEEVLETELLPRSKK